MACALNTLAPSSGWAINFTATVNSNDASGQILTSQATASSSIGSSPTQTYTVSVGAPIGTSGGIGWLELLALVVLCWFSRRKLEKMIV